jgi:hypothetical protein
MFRIKRVLTEEQEKNLQDAIDGDSNLQNIYVMLHEFRNWNREWDLYMSKHPIDASVFAMSLSKKFKVEKINV